MVYDVFLLGNDKFELLDLRLNILNPIVDRFIIIEGNLNFSGTKKPFYLDLKSKIIQPFVHKIISHQIELPEKTNSWGREFFQRNYIFQAIKQLDLKEQDIFLISDLDEIPNPLTVLELIERKEDIESLSFPITFCQKMFYGYLNNFCTNDPNWFGSILVTYKSLMTLGASIQELRDHRNKFPIVSNGGWHFSWMGGAEQVKNKIESYAHTEYDTEYYKDLSRIENALSSNSDILGRNDYKYKPLEVTVENQFPEYLVKNVNKFNHLIKKCQ